MAGPATSSDDDGASDGVLTAAVATLLGFGGQLRFAAHGSTQKAHIIMRRVANDDEEGNTGVIRFSFFAQKRIEVKQGKEILLAIETDNQKFKDVPLVFEGDEALEPPLDAAEPSCPGLLPFAVPPKLRKGPWAKRPYVPHLNQKSKPETASIAIQASPECCSVSVHAAPYHSSRSVQVASDCSSVSVQANVQCTSSSVQATPTHASVAVQQGSVSAEISTQTDLPATTPVANSPILPPAVQLSAPPNSEPLPDFEEDMDISDSEDNDSPMEIGSPSSTSSSISAATSLFPVPSSHSSQTSVPEMMSPSVKLQSPQSSQPPTHDSPRQSPKALSSPAYSPKLSAGSTPLIPLLELDPVPSPNASQLPAQSLLFEGDGRPGGAGITPEGDVRRKNNGDKIDIRSMFVPAKLATGPTDALASIPTGASMLAVALESTPTSKPIVPPQPSRRNGTPPPPNAVASSSKVMLPVKPIPTGPRALSQAAPVDPLQNPLGIRPSTMPRALKGAVSDGPPPTGPKAMSSLLTKKVIAVDGKWSASRRGASAVKAAMITPTSVIKRLKLEGGSEQADTAVEATSTVHLAASEPVAPLPTPATSKWKPVKSEPSEPLSQPAQARPRLLPNHGLPASTYPQSQISKTAQARPPPGFPNCGLPPSALRCESPSAWSRSPSLRRPTPTGPKSTTGECRASNRTLC
ncbi:hypothetical protein BKA70DRAFT_41669 [Coprinopsis sp. MPI-PUGE-AT-0042]|nr:hypothetical protein BKA70DRAFT_41669 [Coprinopsis sp. MPI-PUGE-AT-0042]